jgi:glycosyltransferase involved in cell wall biosynthesis
MKICHISTSDVRGGAARAAYRLHQGLRSAGQDSTMFVARAASDDPAVTLYRPSQRLVHRLSRKLRSILFHVAMARYKATRPAGYEHFRSDQTADAAAPLQQLPVCDLINLHWVADFVDYQAMLVRLAQMKPLMWTLHDMNPFTGGCHYDDVCGRYRDACGACPQLGSTRAQDLSRQVWQHKHRALGQIAPERLHIVASSRWLAREAERSSLLKRFPISVIPSSVDTNVFQPRCVSELRQMLGLPPSRQIVLFVAQSTRNRRKGFSLLLEALVGLQERRDIVLVSIGSGAPDVPTTLPHRHLGSIENDHMLSLVYSLADVFVIPSLQDNLPNTVLEAMACGVPVVGFDVGGIPDMVCEGKTGRLVPVGDVRALREAILDLLDNPMQRAQMASNCRCVAMSEYALEVQAQRYIKLYESGVM